MFINPFLCLFDLQSTYLPLSFLDEDEAACADLLAVRCLVCSSALSFWPFLFVCLSHLASFCSSMD